MNVFHNNMNCISSIVDCVVGVDLCMEEWDVVVLILPFSE